MDIHHLRMQRAAYRQLLRDRASEMTETQINEILDQINIFTELIDFLESKKKK